MPNYLALEPDQLRDQCLNLIRHREQFAVEIDSSKIKDCCILYRSAVLENQNGYSLIRKRAVNTDDASQYVVNLIQAELTFQCNPERMPDGRWEYLFLIKASESRDMMTR